MNYLPSKNIWSLLILVVGIVVSVMIVAGRDRASTAINYASTLVEGEKISLPENPSWQSEFGALSSKLPGEAEPFKSESTTDLVSVSLMSNYLNLKQSGAIDSFSKEELVNQTLEFIENSGTETLKEASLIVVADNGKTSMAEYGERLGLIFKTNKPKLIRNELDILSEAIKSEDPAKMEELQSIISIYEKIGSELARMPVPKTFVKAHLDMTNGVNGMALSLRQLKSVIGDPINGLSVLKSYQTSGSAFMQALRATALFISQNGIVYKQGTGGYYLLYGI